MSSVLNVESDVRSVEPLSEDISTVGDPAGGDNTSELLAQLRRCAMGSRDEATFPFW